MVVGRNNGVVGLTGFSDKKMSGLLFRPKKSGHNNAVVVLTGWSYGGAPLYVANVKQINRTKWKHYIIYVLLNCVVPKIIHTFPTEGIFP